MEVLQKQLQQQEQQTLQEQLPVQQVAEAPKPAPERITAMGRAIMVLNNDVKTFRSGPSFA